MPTCPGAASKMRCAGPVRVQTSTETSTRASLLTPLLALIAGVTLAILLLQHWVLVRSPVTVVPLDASVPAPIDAGVVPDARPLPGPAPKREPPPVRPPPRPVHHQDDSQSLSFAPQGCRRAEAMITCRFQIISHRRDRRLILFTTLKTKRDTWRSILYDQDDRPIVASRAVLASQRNYFGRVSGELPAEQPVEAILEFKGIPPESISIKRLVLTYQVVGFKHAASVSFWDIPLAP